MNEYLIQSLFEKFGNQEYSDLNSFKQAMSNPDGRRMFYDKYLADRGTYDKFENDLVGEQIQVNTPNVTQSTAAPLSSYDLKDLDSVVKNRVDQEIEASKSKRNKDYYVEVAKQFGKTALLGVLAGPPKDINQEEENKLKENRESLYAKYMEEELLNRKFTDKDFTPEQLYDLKFPGKRQEQQRQASLLEKTLKDNMTPNGKISTVNFDDNFLESILNVPQKLAGLLLKAGGVGEFSPEEIMKAEDGDIPGLSKEELLELKQYVAQHEMMRQTSEMDVNNHYRDFVEKSKNKNIPEIDRKALETVTKLDQWHKDGVLNQKLYDENKWALEHIQNMSPEVKQEFDHYEKVSSQLGQNVQKILEKYPNAETAYKLNQQLQKEYDENYSGKGLLLRGAANIAAMFGEVPTRLGSSLEDTFDTIGVIAGNEISEADLIRTAHRFVEKGTYRDATVQQRPVWEKVTDVRVGKDVYQVGYDDVGNITQIYDAFGNIADIDDKTKQLVAKEAAKSGGAANAIEKPNYSAGFNQFLSGSSDLLGTIALALATQGTGTALASSGRAGVAAIGRSMASKGAIASRLREIVPTMFQYTGRLTAEGIREGLNPEQAALYGLMHGFGEGLTEGIFPTLAPVGNKLTSLVDTSVRDGIKALGAKSAKDFVAKYSKRAVLKEMLKVAGSEAVEEGAAEALAPQLNKILNAGLDTNLDTATPTRKDILTAAAFGAAIGFLPGALGAYGQYRQIRHNDGKSFIGQTVYSMVKNIDKAEEMANDFANKLGEEGEVYTDLASNLRETYERSKDILADEKMTDEDKMRNVIAIYNGVVEEKSTTPPEVLPDDESTVKSIFEEADQVEKERQEFEAQQRASTEAQQETEGEDGQLYMNPVSSVDLNAIRSGNVASQTASAIEGAFDPTLLEGESKKTPQTRDNLWSKPVVYQGVQGTLVQKQDDGNWYVITPEGDDILVEGGLSDATNDELGLTEYTPPSSSGGKTGPVERVTRPQRTVESDFTNNKVKINGIDYEYVSTQDSKNGQTVTLKKSDGRTVTVRDPKVVDQILLDKIKHEKNYEGATDEQLVEAITSEPTAKKRGRPSTRTKPQPSAQDTGTPGRNNGKRSVREQVGQERTKIREIEDELNTWFDLVFDVVKKNQNAFAGSSAKFLDDLFTINNTKGTKKGLAKAFGELFAGDADKRSIYIPDKIKRLIGEDSIKRIKQLHADRVELSQLTTPTNVKTRLMIENQELAKKMREERAAKEQATRERLGRKETKPVEKAETKTEPQKRISPRARKRADRLEQMRTPEPTTGSIISQGADLIGDAKKDWMLTQEQALVGETKERKPVAKTLHVREVQDAIANKKYLNAIKQGRMTATDAKTIIDSVGLKVPDYITERLPKVVRTTPESQKTDVVNEGVATEPVKAMQPAQVGIPISKQELTELNKKLQDGKVVKKLDIRLSDQAKQAVDALQAAGHKVLAVGGSVRDALMGLKPKDIDLEVYNITYEQLNDILSKFGKTNLVGKSFGIVKFTDKDGNEYDFSVPRRENRIGTGHKGFEVQFDPTMTPKDAAERRDFSWNGLAYDMDTNEIHDYFGGIKDIRDGVLRHTSEKFSEDPLRILRAMQFQGRFGFKIHPETAKLMKKMVADGALDEISKERIREEWMKWATKSNHPELIFEFLRETGLDEKIPHIGKMKGVPQDSEWHPEGDVEVHTGLVMKAAKEIADREGLVGEERAVLIFSALTHDFAKPQTTEEKVIDGKKRITAYGHEKAGGPLAKEFLSSIGIINSIIEKVVPLVEDHLAHVNISSIKEERGRIAATRKLARRLGPANIGELLRLIEADASGRHPLPKGMPASGVILADIALKANVDKKAVEPILRGRDLIDAGLTPGKMFGSVLSAALEAQEAGVFETLDDAKKWLNKYIDENKLVDSASQPSSTAIVRVDPVNEPIESVDNLFTLLFGKTKGAAVNVLFNRVTNNIAKRLGISKSDYAKRLAVRAVDDIPTAETLNTNNATYSQLIKEIIDEGESEVLNQPNTNIGANSNKRFNEKFHLDPNDITDQWITKLLYKYPKYGEQYENKAALLDGIRKENLEKLHKAETTNEYYLNYISDEYIDNMIDYAENNAEHQLLQQFQTLKRNKVIGIDNIVKGQRAELVASIKYITTDTSYNPVFAKFMIDAIIGDSYTYDSENDKLARRSRSEKGLNTAINPHLSLISNSFALATTQENSGLSTNNVIHDFMYNSHNMINEGVYNREDYAKYEYKKEKEGIWYKFEQTKDTESQVITDFSAMSALSSATPGKWCSGVRSTAVYQMAQGHMYIFMQNNGVPSVQVHATDTEVLEIGGIEDSRQNVREADEPLVANLLSSIPDLRRSEFLDYVEYKKIIKKLNKSGEDSLSDDDVKTLYNASRYVKDNTPALDKALNKLSQKRLLSAFGFDESNVLEYNSEKLINKRRLTISPTIEDLSSKKVIFIPPSIDKNDETTITFNPPEGLEGAYDLSNITIISKGKYPLYINTSSLSEKNEIILGSSFIGSFFKVNSVSDTTKFGGKVTIKYDGQDLKRDNTYVRLVLHADHIEFKDFPVGTRTDYSLVIDQYRPGKDELIIDTGNVESIGDVRYNYYDSTLDTPQDRKLRFKGSVKDINDLYLTGSTASSLEVDLPNVLNINLVHQSVFDSDTVEDTYTYPEKKEGRTYGPMVVINAPKLWGIQSIDAKVKSLEIKSDARNFSVGTMHLDDLQKLELSNRTGIILPKDTTIHNVRSFSEVQNVDDLEPTGPNAIIPIKGVKNIALDGFPRNDGGKERNWFYSRVVFQDVVDLELLGEADNDNFTLVKEMFPLLESIRSSTLANMEILQFEKVPVTRINELEADGKPSTFGTIYGRQSIDSKIKSINGVNIYIETVDTIDRDGNMTTYLSDIFPELNSLKGSNIYVQTGPHPNSKDRVSIVFAVNSPGKNITPDGLGKFIFNYSDYSGTYQEALIDLKGLNSGKLSFIDLIINEWHGEDKTKGNIRLNTGNSNAVIEVSTHNYDNKIPKIDIVVDGSSTRNTISHASRTTFSDFEKMFTFLNEKAEFIHAKILNQDERAAIIIGKNRSAILLSKKKADITSPLHEITHEYEKRVMTAEERKKVLKWTGEKSWTTKTSEAFAKGFERYLYEGNAPSADLKAIFENFKKWLKEIFTSGYFNDINELNADMRNIYAAMLLEDKMDTVSKAKIEPTPSDRKKTFTTNISAQLNRIKQDDAFEGITFNQDGTVYTGGGLITPLASDNVKKDNLTVKQVSDFAEVAHEVPEDSNVKVGLFPMSDVKNADTSIDVNLVIPGERRELAVEFARLSGQHSIWDADNQELILTGESGKNPVKYTKKQLVSIIEKLNRGILPIEEINEAKGLKPEKTKFVKRADGTVDQVKVVDSSGNAVLVTDAEHGIHGVSKDELHDSEEKARETKPKKKKTGGKVSAADEAKAFIKSQFPEITTEPVLATEKARHTNGEHGLYVGMTTFNKNGEKYVISGFTGSGKTLSVIVASDAGLGDMVLETEYDDHFDPGQSKKSAMVQSFLDLLGTTEQPTEQPAGEATGEVTGEDVQQEREPEVRDVEEREVPIVAGELQVDDIVMFDGWKYKITSIKGKKVNLKRVGGVGGANDINISDLAAKVVTTDATGPILNNEVDIRRAVENIAKTSEQYAHPAGPELHQITLMTLDMMMKTDVDPSSIRALKMLMSEIKAAKTSEEIKALAARYEKIRKAEIKKSHKILTNESGEGVLYTTTLKDLLDKVDSNDPAWRRLLPILKRLDVKVVVRKPVFGLAGTWNSDTNTITLFSGLSTVFDSVHEGIHGLTSYALMNNPDLLKEVEDMMTRLRKELAKPKYKALYPGILDNYGFTNAHEFLAELFTNDEFAAVMSSVPASLGSTNYTGISVLDAIIDLAFRALRYVGLMEKSQSVQDYWLNYIEQNESDLRKEIEYAVKNQNRRVNNSLTLNNVRLYHGTPNIFNDGIKINHGPSYGFFTTDDANVATWYRDRKNTYSRRALLKYVLKPNAKVLNLSDDADMEAFLIDSVGIQMDDEIRALIENGEIFTLEMGKVADRVVKTGQNQGYDVVVFNDRTAGQKHLSYVIVNTEAIEEDPEGHEYVMMNNIPNFFKKLFRGNAQKLEGTENELTSEEKTIVPPQTEEQIESDVKKEYILEGIARLIQKGKLVNDPDAIYKAAGNTLRKKGITQAELRAYLLPSVIVDNVAPPPVESETPEGPLEGITPAEAEASAQAQETASGATVPPPPPPATREDGDEGLTPEQFTVKNRILQDIRDNIYTIKGVNRLTPKTFELDQYVREAVRDMISPDGSMKLEMALIKDVLLGIRSESGSMAAETVAIGYTIIRLRERMARQLEIFAQAEENGSPDTARYWADLNATDAWLERATRAGHILGSEASHALLIRKEVLPQDPLDEINAMIERVNKKRRKNGKAEFKLAQLETKEMTSLRQKIFVLKSKLKDVRSTLRKIGYDGKKGLFNAQVEALKKQNKEERQKIKAAKSLNDAIQNLNDVLSGKIC